MFDRRRKTLSPVLSDEPLVGTDIKRRVRVVLLAVVIAFALTNLSSYFIGQAVRVDADRDNRARIDALERRFAADLDERRRERDAEVARQDADLRQLRRDACTLADRIRPRDADLDKLRRRYGCTVPPPAAGPTSGPPAAGGRTAAPAPRPAPGPRAPASTSGPAAPGTTPPAPPDSGRMCLPVVGCAL